METIKNRRPMETSPEGPSFLGRSRTWQYGASSHLSRHAIRASIPAQIAERSNADDLVSFSNVNPRRRHHAKERREVAGDNIAVKGVDGNIELFNPKARREVAGDNIPVKSVDGNVELFNPKARREVAGDNIPVKSVNGNVELFNPTTPKRRHHVKERRQTDIDDEKYAVQSINGVITRYHPSGKRQVEGENVKLSDGAAMVPFHDKRSQMKREPQVNTFPSNIASRSEGGEIYAF
ncbi:hypothetical protein FRB96_006117 [Tulasnella sp. 330]|nr:hypothetical protein FRB96_006117 [Tulasnella sp. 330]